MHLFIWLLQLYSSRDAALKQSKLLSCEGACDACTLKGTLSDMGIAMEALCYKKGMLCDVSKHKPTDSTKSSCLAPASHTRSCHTHHSDQDVSHV